MTGTAVVPTTYPMIRTWLGEGVYHLRQQCGDFTADETRWIELAQWALGCRLGDRELCDLCMTARGYQRVSPVASIDWGNGSTTDPDPEDEDDE